MTDMFCRDGVRMKVGVRRCSVGKNLGNQGSDVIIFLSNVISPYMRINQNCRTYRWIRLLLYYLYVEQHC